MYNIELFDFICNGNIEKSLYNTCIFLIENSKIEVLEDTIIHVCCYIGTIISIYNIAKFNDVINITINIINSDNINVIEYLQLITKLCILCDIQIKNPTIKTGTIPLPQLREKIFNVFNNNIKLNPAGLNKFDIIIPPINSDIYDLILKIITSFIQLFKILETTDSITDIYNISILFRDSFDYIIRKKYVIQTKFCLNEHEPIYFLWGFINCLFTDNIDIVNYYKLFIYNNNKKTTKTIKNQRIGLIFGAAIAIIFNYKKKLIYSWNNNELQILQQINNISIKLYKQVQKEISIVPDNNEKKIDKNKIDGLNYLYDYIPKFSNDNIKYNTSVFEEEFKTIIK
jgi:hypothetical protein